MPGLTPQAGAIPMMQNNGNMVFMSPNLNPTATMQQQQHQEPTTTTAAPVTNSIQGSTVSEENDMTEPMAGNATDTNSTMDSILEHGGGIESEQQNTDNNTGVSEQTVASADQQQQSTNDPNLQFANTSSLNLNSNSQQGLLTSMPTSSAQFSFPSTATPLTVSTATGGNFLSTPKPGILNQTPGQLANIVPNQNSGTVTFGRQQVGPLSGTLVLHNGQLILLPFSDKGGVNTNMLPGIGGNSLPIGGTGVLNNSSTLALPPNQPNTGVIPPQNNSLNVGGFPLNTQNQSHPSAFLLSNGQVVPVVTQPNMVVPPLNNGLYLNGQTQIAGKLPGNGLLTSSSSGLLMTTTSTTTLFPSGAAIPQPVRPTITQFTTKPTGTPALTTLTNTTRLPGIVKTTPGTAPSTPGGLPTTMSAMLTPDGNIILTLPPGGNNPPTSKAGTQATVIVAGGKKVQTRIMPKPTGAGAAVQQTPAGTCRLRA